MAERKDGAMTTDDGSLGEAEGARDAQGDGVEARSESGGDPSEGPLTSEIEALRSELEEARDRHLRLAAEFDNFRRRSVQQLAEAETRAQASLIGRLLDALDDLGRVTALDPEAATVEALLEGVALVERKVFHLLREAGLEELNPAGDPFDPNLMEAMVRVPAESEEEDDLVGDVLQRGFLFAGHLVRPARVSVRKFG